LRRGLYCMLANLPNGRHPVRIVGNPGNRKPQGQCQQIGINRDPELGIIWAEDLYKPFADWLVNELEEATKAI
jgi:hypothetical protein